MESTRTQRVLVEEDTHCTYVLAPTERDTRNRNLIAMIFPSKYTLCPGVNIWMDSFTMAHKDLAKYQVEIRALVQQLQRQDRELERAQPYPFYQSELEKIPVGTLLRHPEEGQRHLFSVEHLQGRTARAGVPWECVLGDKLIRQVW